MIKQITIIVKRNTKKAIMYIVVFCFLGVNCFGQKKSGLHDNLIFKNFTTKEGLSQRSVITILQDDEGFMWFGTRYGLNKFDGSSFQAYNYNSQDEGSLSNNRINTLALDKNGKMWVGTESGLNQYMPRNNNFKRVKIANNQGRYYTKNILEIVPSDTTFLWLATNKGLDRFNTKTGDIYGIEDFIQGTLSSNNITSTIKDDNKDLWICTAEKIHLFNPHNKTLKTYNFPENKSPNTTKNFTTDLFKDNEGNIWLGYDGGLAFFNKISKTFEDYRIDTNKAIINPVRSICQDKKGLFWIGSYQGLYALNLETRSIIKYKHDVDNSKSLSQNSIYKVFEDARGDLWIGTWAGGINYVDRSINNFLTFTAGSSNKHLSYKVVSSIVEDANENLWIGTEGGGINVYDINKQSFKFYQHNPKDPSSLKTNNIKAILKGDKGDLWVGTHGEGLSLYNLNHSDNRFKHFKSIPGSLNSIDDSKITALVEDVNHNIWIGTNKGGLNFFDVKSKTFSKIKDPDQILGVSIYTIYKSANENILYVGSQNGLAEIDVNLKEIKNIRFRNKSGNLPFTVKQVISIFESSANNLWVGTEGDGLYHYNCSTGKSINYGSAEGLPNAVVYGILSDAHENIWVSTNKGISRINPDTKNIKNFDETDGIQGNEFNYGACLKTKKGQLVFGGTSGLTIFNPDKIIENETYIPPVQITRFKVRNKPFLKNITTKEEIELKHNQNDFGFDFVALGFAHPQKHQYAYKLHGFDSDWNYIGNQKTATYTNLNPGRYEFEVKASNGYGDWSKIPKKVILNIKTPFWKTWWAYLSYLIILTGLSLTIRKYALLRIRDKRQLKLERLDREKVEEVNRLKLQLFTNISHDFRTPLTLIIGPLKKLIEKNKGDSSLQKQLSVMYRNASTLLQLINQLLDFRKSETGKLQVYFSKHDMIVFLKRIKSSFDELARERDITYKLETSESCVDVWFDKIEMKKVVLNILSNAFKFTPQHGEILIKVSKGVKLDKNSAIKIEFEDSGRGIPEDDLEFVFDRYFQLGQQNEFRSGTGVGLALAKDIVELHSGEIYVKNNMEKGTCFSVLLPLGNNHIEPKNIIAEEYLDSDIIDYTEITNVQSKWIGDNNVIRVPEINETLSSILVVEDNKEVRAFIKENFENNFNVFEADNGIEGIQTARVYPIDVIISDVMMPQMNGLEMCRLIKSDIRTSHIPVVLLTARTSSKVQQKGYEKGADVYLTKPFDGDVLKLQVSNILKSRQDLVDKFKKDILIEPKEITVVSADELFLTRSMEIIERNLSNTQFNVSAFTKEIGMSQTVVYKKVKALTGQSISEFIRTVRLKKASQLLLQTNMNVSSIAYDVGFNDIKYFRKCFKNTFKETPSKYRKDKSKEF